MKSRMFEAVYVDVMYNDYCERELTKNIYIFPILTATMQFKRPSPAVDVILFNVSLYFV